MTEAERVRLCALPNPEPCVCGHSGTCPVCVREDAIFAAELFAIELTERACGLEGAKP